MAEHVSTIGLFVDPKTTEAEMYYRQYGFIPVEPDTESTKELWLPIVTCKEVVDAAS